MKAAMIEVDKELPGVSPKSRMLLQVHDELVLEVPDKDVKKVSALVKTIMEKAATLNVPIAVEVGTGKNWGETK